jgi:hexosaminidase
MHPSSTLLPSPRRVRPREGAFRLRRHLPIVLTRTDDDDFRSASALRDAVAKRTGLQLPIETHANVKGLGRHIALSRASESGQGYRLRVRPDAISIVGDGAAGLRYGVETLAQMTRTSIPACDITDAPDLERRGLLIDISRGKVPTLETLEQIVDLMVQLKLNMLMLYTEHTFEFRRHPLISKGASPMNAAELRKLDRYAAERHIELVPTLQSLGHMHHLLNISRYRHLAESDRRWSVSPALEGTYKLLEELYSEYIGNFRSSWFNANCDEPVDLGKGRSKARADKEGRGAVFRAHLERVEALAKKFGSKTMVWGDVVHEHPEQIPLLSRELMLLDWWYEADHDFRRVRVFKKHRIPFMVCAGTASWNTLFPRGDNAIANIKGHADAGKKYGADGFINTDWGDNGAYNLFGNSLYGIAWGAQASWGTTKLDAHAFSRAFSRQIFGDASGVTGRIYRKLGGLHQTGFDHFNNSPLKTLYFDDVIQAKFTSQVKPPVLTRTLDALNKVRDTFAANQHRFTGRPIASEEIRFAIDASIFAAEKGLARKRPKTLAREQRRLLARHHQLWLARNRPSNFRPTEKLYQTSIRSLERM